MSAAEESRNDGGDGDRVEFLYTGQAMVVIPRDVARVRVGPSVKKIDRKAFYLCQQLQEVDLCEELEEIDYEAFTRCTSLKHIRIPPTVKFIGGEAFMHCEQLEEVVLCEGLEEIGEFAFSECKCLKRIRIPPTVKKINEVAFAECEQLQEVELCDGLEEIHYHAFKGCKSLKHIRIPPTVKFIGWEAFRRCEELEEVTIFEGLEEIGEFAFGDCKRLKRIRIPPTIKKIYDRAFRYCEQLEEVDLCHYLEEIGDFAFQGCKCLKWIRIPSTIKKIGGCAFQGCEQLEEAELVGELEEIDACAFQGCKCLKRVRIPSTVKQIGEGAFEECEQLEEVYLCEELEVIDDRAFNGCKSLKHIRIPPTVKRIGMWAFLDCDRLEKVDICEGLEEIATHAFKRCKCLKRVIIPSTVKRIGEGAFTYCDQLEGVELCEGLEEIGGCAFENCLSLRNISVPSSLKLMGAHALRGCHDIRKLFDSENMILNALKCRLDGLPVHQLCYYQSRQPAQSILEKLQNIFDKMSHQVEASIAAESSPAQKRRDEKWAAIWSGSSQELKERCHGASGSGVASGSALENGASYVSIKISNKIHRNQDCLGMTPLHILACSTKQNLALYKLLIANQPISLITKDKWGCLPIFYAIWGRRSPVIVQFLIDSQKSAFPDIDLNWDMMVSTLCRAAAPLDLVQKLIKIKQESFPEQSISFQRAARELTIHCLVECDSFDEDFPSRWEFMMKIFSNYHAQQGLFESLLEIQQSFFPDQSITIWQVVCEEFVKPLKGWWEPESTILSSSMFQFLVRCSIPERLHTVGLRKWQKHIEHLVERRKLLPLKSPFTDLIHSKLAFYECVYPQLREKTSLIELALWKSKIDESIATSTNAGSSDKSNELSDDMKTQCRINCGAEIIISNVLPYLIADAEEEGKR